MVMKPKIETEALEGHLSFLQLICNNETQLFVYKVSHTTQKPVEPPPPPKATHTPGRKLTRTPKTVSPKDQPCERLGSPQ